MIWKERETSQILNMISFLKDFHFVKELGIEIEVAEPGSHVSYIYMMLPG